VSNRRLSLLVALMALAANTLADTLVLRSGRRIEGDLVGVRGSTVEFDESGSSKRRYDRSEVARIELGSGSSSSSSYDRNGGRPSGLRERTTSVDAASHWSDTGIDVRSGTSVYFEASGSEPFLIGDERGPIRMRESGRLSLGVNDDFLEDNRGSFRVTIYY
jgi:hypothetical protein